LAKAGKVSGSYLLFAMLGLLFVISILAVKRPQAPQAYSVQVEDLVASRGETLAAGGKLKAFRLRRPPLSPAGATSLRLDMRMLRILLLLRELFPAPLALQAGSQRLVLVETPPWKFR